MEARMSGWDWLRAGLEAATYEKYRKAQQDIAEAKTEKEIEAARREMLQAKKSIIFDISRNIQLSEEHVREFPQQVYFVAKSLELRLANNEMPENLFPESQDLLFFLDTQKKITEVLAKSKAGLTQEQIQQSDLAVRYIVEMPILQQAISNKSAQLSLSAVDQKWRELRNLQNKNKLYKRLGIIGFIFALVIEIPLAIWDLLPAFILYKPICATVLLVTLIGSFILLILGRKPNPEYNLMKANRRVWRKQLMPKNDWQQVVSTFGDLTTEQFQKILSERLDFLKPLLGDDLQKFLISAE
jgi:hypothetical protein